MCVYAYACAYILLLGTFKQKLLHVSLTGNEVPLDYVYPTLVQSSSVLWALGMLLTAQSRIFVAAV